MEPIVYERSKWHNWPEILEDHKRSGLTVRQYCLAHNLNEKTFYNARHKYLGSSANVTSSQFAEVKPITGNDDHLVLSSGRLNISVNSSTSDELLIKVLKVLSNV